MHVIPRWRQSRRANQSDLEDHMMETRRLTRKSAQPTKKKPEETGEKKDGDSEVPPSRENECGSDGEVRCFCNSQREGAPVSSKGQEH